MLNLNCYNFKKLRIFTLILFICTVIVSSSPPVPSKKKLDSRSGVTANEYVPNKRLRIANSVDSGSITIMSAKSIISSEDCSSKLDDYSEIGEEVTEIFRKFDFLAALFYSEDEKLYRIRQEQFIEQIRMLILQSIDDSSQQHKSALLYYLGRTSSNTIEEYRSEMSQAFTFIKIQMFEQLGTLCSVLDDIFDGIKIFPIINARLDNLSSSGTNGSTTPKNLECMDSEDEIESAFNKIKLGREGSSNNNGGLNEEPGPSSYNFPSSPGSECYRLDRSVCENDYDIETQIYSSEAESDNNSGDLIRDSNGSEVSIPSKVSRQKSSEDGSDKSGAEKHKKVMEHLKIVEKNKFNLEDLSFNEVYNEVSKNYRLLNTQKLYLGKDRSNNEMSLNDMKTFLSHIKEGYMPKFGRFQSKLAQAFTACMIIMQETGMITHLMSEYKVKHARSKFIVDTLFEVTKEREEYEEDEHAGDYLGLNEFYELKKFNRSKKRVHPNIRKGATTVKLAAMQFAINTFPELSIDVDQAHDKGVLGSEKHEDLDDLEDVLLKKEITVLIYPKDYEVFLNFHSRKMNSFYNRFLSLAVRILERHYLRLSRERIKIRYKRTSDPIEDLIEKKGHMTGMYFIMEDIYPSEALFGSNIETAKVPMLSYNSFILIHRKYGVRDLDSWQRFVRYPPDEKRIIITNFSNKPLFINAGSYKVIPIVLTNHGDSPLLKMLEFNPTAGVFWGLDSKRYSYGDFNIIDFPYCSIQGPYFRRDS